MTKKDIEQYEIDVDDIFDDDLADDHGLKDEFLTDQSAAEVYMKPFKIHGQPIELFIHRSMFKEVNLSIEARADLSIHITVPEDFDLEQTDQAVETLRPQIEAVYEQARIANDRLLSMWVLKTMDDSDGVLFFGQLYPLHYKVGEWYKPYYRVDFENQECVITVPEDGGEIIEMVKAITEELEARTQVVFESYLNYYLTRFEELPEKMPTIQLVEYLPTPTSVDLETGMISINPTLSQFPEGCVEYCAASALCRLIDLGNQKLHEEYMDKAMPDWRRWASEFEI
ncbi:YgjP-like metallopeptidase domain-containing protein [Erysipelotrichaceae bacterium 51-3]